MPMNARSGGVAGWPQYYRCRSLNDRGSTSSDGEASPDAADVNSPVKFLAVASKVFAKPRGPGCPSTVVATVTMHSSTLIALGVKPRVPSAVQQRCSDESKYGRPCWTSCRVFVRLVPRRRRRVRLERSLAPKRGMIVTWHDRQSVAICRSCSKQSLLLRKNAVCSEKQTGKQQNGRLALSVCCLFSHAKKMRGLLTGVFWKKPDLATVMIGRSRYLIRASCTFESPAEVDAIST